MTPVRDVTRICGAALSAFLLVACGGSDKDSFNAEKSPYGARTPTTKMTSTLSFSSTTLLSSPDIEQTTTVVGEKTIGGKTYDRLATLDVADPTQGGEYWIKENPDGTVELAGVELHSTLVDPVLPSGSLVLDAPIVVKKDPPIGQEQVVSSSGTYTPKGSANGVSVTATGKYTLVEKDAVAQTQWGPLTGCNHYRGSISGTSSLLPAVLQGVTITGEMWYHPSFGVVAFKAPALGVETSMKEADDCGADDASGYRTIRKVGNVDASSGKFELSVYDCTGDFTADKNVHAKMLLELRFQDETAAKTTTQPSNSYEFQTVFGQFPSMLVQSPVSVLHPEENGKGFVYWIAFVDQAAKNEAGGNGISYGVEVLPAKSGNPVRASARIYYKTLKP